MRSTLKWLGSEPFRVFFFTGAWFGIAGVLLWPLFYAGWLPFYPGISHARVMVQAFGGAFVIGFLGTAGPRMLSAPKLTVVELAALVTLHLVGGWFHLCNRTTWGDVSFLALLSVLVACLGRRMVSCGGERPPPPMMLAALGIACGLAGTVMWLNPAWHDTATSYRMANLLLDQGFLLGPIMGVGAFLFPRLLGGEFGGPISDSQRVFAFWRTVFAAGTLLASFDVEVAGRRWISGVLKALALVIAFSGIRWIRPPFGSPVGTLANALRGCCLPMLFVGAVASAMDESHRISLEHFLFIGGYGLLCLVVASRVLFGHSGDLPGFSRASSLPRVLVSLAVLAAFTRVSAEFWPHIMISHHVYAAVLWAAVTLLWLFWHHGRFWKKDPEPD